MALLSKRIPSTRLLLRYSRWDSEGGDEGREEALLTDRQKETASSSA